MATESLEQRKQRLVRSIIEKRAKIQLSSERIQDALPVSVAQLNQVQKVASGPSGVKEGFAFVKKAAELGLSRYKKPTGLLTKGQQLSGPLQQLSKKVPLKPFLIGLAGAILLSLVLGQQSKRKKNKQRKENERQQVAKFGLGVLVLKWLLSASQPALKKALLQLVKKKVVG